MNKFHNLKSLQHACSEEHQKALIRAKREMGFGGVFASRGRYFYAFDDKGNVMAGEAESHPWNGTMKQLRSAIEDARMLGAHRLEICCGINWAESPQAMADWDYIPWVEEWRIDVWVDEVPTKNQSSTTTQPE
jgi:hypothetical protein